MVRGAHNFLDSGGPGLGWTLGRLWAHLEPTLGRLWADLGPTLSLQIPELFSGPQNGTFFFLSVKAAVSRSDEGTTRSAGNSEKFTPQYRRESGEVRP